MRTKLLNHGISNVHTAALLLGAAGLLSRLLALLRDRLLTAHFGIGRELDIYNAAFQIPDFMSVLFLLGAGTSAILPLFQEYAVADKEKAKRLIFDLLTVFLGGAFVVSGVVFLAAPMLMRIIVPGFSSADQALTATLTRIMIFSPVLFGISGIVSSVAQSYERFIAYAVAPLLYNLGIIFGILVLAPRGGVVGLGVGVVLGAALHMAVQFRATQDLGFTLHAFFRHIRSGGRRSMSAFFTAGVRRVSRLSLPRVLAISFSQLTFIALIALGSRLVAGSITVFSFAQNIYFVPIGVFALGYTVALFPRLNSAYLARDGDIFFRELFTGMRAILFWILPVSVLIIVLRAHVVRTALGAHSFTWNDTRLTAASLAILAVALAAGSLVALFIKCFHTIEDTWRPLIISFVSSIVSLAVAVLTMRALADHTFFGRAVGEILRIADLGHYEVVGLSFGFAAGLALNALLLYVVLTKVARRKMPSRMRFPTIPMLGMLSASLVAGVAAYGVRVSFSEVLPLLSLWSVVLQGACASLVGAVAYGGVLIILRDENMLTLVRFAGWHSVGTAAVLPLVPDDGLGGPQMH
ncbi:MAG: lipid II flippase MurJ [Candidatus Sungbacteria bacterium]|nr:lipid II flippase MurJ [Candidatus Sungbacteria bacterium]